MGGKKEKDKYQKFLERLELIRSLKLPPLEGAPSCALKETKPGAVLILGGSAYRVQSHSELRDSRGGVWFRKSILLFPDSKSFLLELKGENFEEIWLWEAAGKCSAESLYDKVQLAREIAAAVPTLEGTLSVRNKDWAAIYRPGQKGEMVDFLELAKDGGENERFLVEASRSSREANIYSGRRISAPDIEVLFGG